MLGIHGAWDLVIPLTSTRLGWVSKDRDFVALATVSRDTLRLSGGLAALSEYREYYQRIAQRRAQEAGLEGVPVGGPRNTQDNK